MNDNDKKKSITFSEKFQMPLPVGRKLCMIDKREWRRLLDMLRKSVQPVKWYELVGTFFLAGSLACIGYSLSCPGYAIAFWIAAVFSALTGALLFFFASRERKSAIYTKDEILEYAEDIVLSEAGSADDALGGAQYSRQHKPWVAKCRPRNPQGVDHMELQLTGRSLRELAFKVKSANSYWRAGFKLEVPGAADSMPKLISGKSLLFHVGRNEQGLYALSTYRDGAQPNHQKLTVLDSEDIQLMIKSDEANNVKCFVNDHPMYTATLDPQVFKRVFLAAWGDGREYQVFFYDIAYIVD